jgi:chromosome segregation ATPase
LEREHQQQGENINLHRLYADLEAKNAGLEAENTRLLEANRRLQQKKDQQEKTHEQEERRTREQLMGAWRDDVDAQKKETSKEITKLKETSSNQLRDLELQRSIIGDLNGKLNDSEREMRQKNGKIEENNEEIRRLRNQLQAQQSFPTMQMQMQSMQMQLDQTQAQLGQYVTYNFNLRSYATRLEQQRDYLQQVILNMQASSGNGGDNQNTERFREMEAELRAAKEKLSDEKHLTERVRITSFEEYIKQSSNEGNSIRECINRIAGLLTSADLRGQLSSIKELANQLNYICENLEQLMRNSNAVTMYRQLSVLFHPDKTKENRFIAAYFVEIMKELNDLKDRYNK